MSHPYKNRPIAETHVWLTPPEIISCLGDFDLDPCAAPEPRPWDTARRHITLPDDGLGAAWDGRVWCNPPFGNNTSAWLERLARHQNGIALVFARTETSMFQRFVWPSAHSILFIAKRPHFYRPDGTRSKGNSGGPICLIAYGHHNGEALAKSGIAGAIVQVTDVVERSQNA